MIVLILLACLSIFILGGMAFRSSERAILENYQTTYRVALKNSGRVLDMNLRNILEVVRDFLNDKNLRKVLKKGANRNSAFSTADREALEAVKGYSEDPRQLLCEDYDLLLRLYAAGYRGLNLRERK